MREHGLFIFQIISDLIGNENRSEVFSGVPRQPTWGRGAIFFEGNIIFS
jgi:hypothetical protein